VALPRVPRGVPFVAASGTLTEALAIPVDEALVGGGAVYFQLWCRDLGSMTGASSTNALELWIG
jgi:hypothetical protein